MAETEQQLRKRAEAMFKDNCLDSPVDMYVRLNQFEQAFEDRCAKEVEMVEAAITLAQVELARDVLKTVRAERVKGDGAKARGSVIDVYDLAVDDITAALVALFRSQGIEIDQKEGETDGL